MKAPDFTYVRAGTLSDAFRLKAEHGPDSRWLAGGQSLLAALAFRLSEPTALIDISRVTELQGITQRIEQSKPIVRIGAGTTHTQLGTSELIRQHVPLLAQAVPHIAHIAIRNRGTIGGSLAFADPAAEIPACCVALDATIVIGGAKGERRVPAREFFLGLYATALNDAELIVAIEIPALLPGEQHVLMEVTRRSGDYAMAGVAAVIRRKGEISDSARLAFFSMSDKPVEASNAAQALIGHVLDETQIELAVRALQRDLDPAGDLNGGPETKRHLASVVLRRALSQFTSNSPRTAA